MTILSEPPAVQTLPVVATLYLHGVKSSQAVDVYGGGSLRYKFRWDEKRRIVCRDYTSTEQFKKEEQDIRRHRAPSHMVCTYMGSPDVAQAAIEAADVLIAENLRIALHRKAEVLELIARRISESLGTKDSQPTSATAPPGDTSQSAQEFQGSQDSSQSQAQSGGVQSSPQPTAPPAPKAIAPYLPPGWQRIGRTALIRGSITETRAMAKVCGINSSDRMEIVEEICRLQGRESAPTGPVLTTDDMTGEVLKNDGVPLTAAEMHATSADTAE